MGLSLARQDPASRARRRALGRAIILLPVMLALLSVEARSVTITNVTTGEVLFLDDFETAIAVAGPYSEGGPDADPTPQIGSWAVTEVFSYLVQVTDSTPPADPGPAQGSQYLRMVRDFDTTGQELRGFLAATQSTPGDVIRLETMAWIGDEEGSRLNLQLVGSSGHARASVRADAGRVLAQTASSNQPVDTGLRYTTMTWHRFALEYTVGSAQFSVGLDGQTTSGIVAPGPVGDVEHVRLQNANARPGILFADAVPAASSVPEPSSIVLGILGLGAAGLVRRRPSRGSGGAGAEGVARRAHGLHQG